MSAGPAEFEAGRREREAIAKAKMSDASRALLLDKVIFDKLRKQIPTDEVDDFSLSVVIHNIRKIIRDS